MQRSSGRNIVVIVAILLLGVGILAAATTFVTQERTNTGPSAPSETVGPGSEADINTPDIGSSGKDSGQGQGSFEVEAQPIKLPPIDFGGL